MERGVSSVPENSDRILAAVLAMEIGGRGVTVNSILPTAIEGAGVFSEGVRPEIREFVKSFRPI
jgi:3-oxoacyl-[acyl-carrier protein] reductase